MIEIVPKWRRQNVNESKSENVCMWLELESNREMMTQSNYGCDYSRWNSDENWLVFHRVNDEWRKWWSCQRNDAFLVGLVWQINLFTNNSMLKMNPRLLNTQCTKRINNQNIRHFCCVFVSVNYYVFKWTCEIIKLLISLINWPLFNQFQLYSTCLHTAFFYFH